MNGVDCKALLFEMIQAKSQVCMRDPEHTSSQSSLFLTANEAMGDSDITGIVSVSGAAVSWSQQSVTASSPELSGPALRVSVPAATDSRLG